MTRWPRIRAAGSAGGRSRTAVSSTDSRTTSAAHTTTAAKPADGRLPARSGVLREDRLGGHLGGTTSRLLRLLDVHGPSELDFALAEAHRRGAFAAQSVAHILDQRRRARKAAVPLPIVLPDDPRVRDLRVPARPLGAYDALARSGEKKGGRP